MQFRLLAIYAAVAACGAGLAQAEVSIDGSFSGGVSYNNLGNTKSGFAEYDVTIGISGSDKLDNRGEVIWRLEQGADGEESRWGGKEAWIGLADDDVGTFRAGKIKTPFYQTLDDLYGDSGASFLVSEYTPGASYRPGQYIRYDLPTLGGFSASVGYDPDSGTRSKYGYDIAAHYKLSGFFADAAYQKRKAADGTNDSTVDNAAQFDSHSWFALAGYDFGNGFGVNGGYKRSEYTPLGEAAVRQHLAFGQGSYKVGKHGVTVTYLQLGNQGSAADTGAKALAARYDYSLSKHSIAYLEGRYLKNDSQASYTTFDATLEGKGDSVGVPGSKAYRLLAGLKTTF